MSSDWTFLARFSCLQFKIGLWWWWRIDIGDYYFVVLLSVSIDRLDYRSVGHHSQSSQFLLQIPKSDYCSGSLSALYLIYNILPSPPHIYLTLMTVFIFTTLQYFLVVFTFLGLLAWRRGIFSSHPSLIGTQNLPTTLQTALMKTKCKNFGIRPFQVIHI